MITQIEAAKKIKESNGKFFTVTFNKRSDGAKRVMNARTNVVKHLKGGKQKYDPAKYKLLTVYDVISKGYRMIPIDGIINLKINKKEFTVS